MEGFNIVFGDDCMGLYRDDRLMVAATKLTFADVIEACGISCDLWEIDLERYDSPEKLPQTFGELGLGKEDKVDITI